VKNLRVARRYAVALLSTAEERKNVDAVSTDVSMIDGLIRGSRELHLFLLSPVITASQKAEVLKGLLESRVAKDTLTFILLLVRKGREAVLPEILEQFSALRDERLGIVNVHVRSAVQVAGTQHQSLQKELERYTKKKVRMHLTIDESLKGGLTIRIGDTVFDASVRRQLEMLHSRFLAGDVAS